MRLLALGLLVCSVALVGCEQKPAPVSPSTGSSSSGTSDSAMNASNTDSSMMASQSAAASDKTTLISLRVPEMSCPVSCLPEVKRVLTAQSGVESVELAEQKEEGIIDNRMVYIQASSDFDLTSAIAALSDAGFAGSSKE